MKNYKLLNGFLILGLLLLYPYFSDVMAQNKDNWTLLGRKTVNTDQGQGEIKVAAAKGELKVSKIRIKVKAAPLEMKSIVIQYRNGEKHPVNLKKNFKKNTFSRDIPLRGDDERAIKKVELKFTKKEQSGSKPIVELFGM